MTGVDIAGLVEELRAAADAHGNTALHPYCLYAKAASALSSQPLSLSEAREEIERLRGQAAGFRTALRTIAEPIVGTPIGDPWAFYADLQAVANSALVSGSREDGE